MSSSVASSTFSVFNLDSARLGREFELYLKCRVDDVKSYKELLDMSMRGSEIAKGYIAVLFLRKDISQIMKTFQVGDSLSSATIMIEDIVDWLEAPAQANNPHALYIMGFCLQYGIHWERNGPKALTFIERASDMGHTSAQCKLGYAYNSGTDVEQNRQVAFELYMKAAKAGYAIAQSNIAVEYSTGTGAVAQNLPVAASYYKLAADQGDKESQYCLGYAYSTGKGVEEDMEEAIKYYKLSAEKEFVYAQYSLGFCYFYGKGVSIDTEMAISYYRKAADQGHAASQKFLEDFYENITDNVDAKEEIISAQRSVDDDNDLDAEALFLQAEAYYNGEGKNENIKKAVDLYRKAAELGHGEALFKMGNFYLKGADGVSQSPEIAVQYYAMAADEGHKRSLYELGTCYSRGIGVEVDKGEAVRYFRLSAEAQDATNAASCTVS